MEMATTPSADKDNDVPNIEDAASSEVTVVGDSGKEPPKKKKKVAVNEIDIDKLELELLQGQKDHKKKELTGDADPWDKDNPFNFTVFGLPRQLKVSVPKGQSPVWDFYLCLDVKAVEITNLKTKRGGGSEGGVGIKAFMPVVESKRISTHICRCCIEDLQDTQCTIVSWRRALCKHQNVANAEKHLTNKHGDNPKVIKFLEDKANKKHSTGAFDSGNAGEIGNPGGHTMITKAIRQTKDERTRHLTATWLINNHLGHNTTQSDEFRDLMTHLDPGFKPIDRSTFNKILQQQFKRMISGIVKILCDNANDFDGVKWLTIGHDIWNTVVMDGALGSCIRIMTKDMEVYNIAAVLRKHNVSHCADEVGDVLEEVYQTR